MKVCLIGSVEFSDRALDTLLTLADSGVIEIAGVVTKKKSDFNADFVDLRESLIRRALLKVDTHYYKDDNALLEFVKRVAPDVIYCFGWSSLLSKDVLNSAPLGVIGFHPAELPKNRGRHPIIWALVLGLTETASTFFKMDEGADSGPIISQEMLSISVGETARSLYDKITMTALRQIAEFTEELAVGRAVFRTQDHELANTWRKRSQRDGLIDWRMSAESIDNLVKALSEPYPGAEFLLESGEIVKVWQTNINSEAVPANHEPGKVLKILDQSILVKCGGASSIWLTHVEPQIAPVEGAYI